MREYSNDIPLDDDGNISSTFVPKSKNKEKYCI